MTDRGSTIRLGTRSSALARWQAEWVAERLRAFHVDVELVFITTQGDVRTGSLSTFGGVGAFTKELQRALLAGTIDLAVHSLKDLPTDQPSELVIAAVPPRASIYDALVSNCACTLEQLPERARVGTGSIRRRAQLLALRPDLEIADIRGNIDTRLRKMDEGRFDAIILAEAGLRRLGWGWRIAEVLGPPRMLPAVGQGALGLETRRDDERTRHWVAHLDDLEARAAITAERELLARLRAGCSAPVGAWARVDSGRLALDAVVLTADGRESLRACHEGHISQAADLGRYVADQLLQQGAERLIASIMRS